jgi:hypothetical protein
MPEERQAIHAYLSVTAMTAWQAFAEENGVSITGLLESLGLNLATEIAETGDADIRQDWVRAGRKVDAIRRRRGGMQ